MIETCGKKKQNKTFSYCSTSFFLIAFGPKRKLGLVLGMQFPQRAPRSCAPTYPCAFQTYKKGASRRKEHLRDHQNGSVAAVNGHTNRFASLENNVKPRKQRKDWGRRVANLQTTSSDCKHSMSCSRCLLTAAITSAAYNSVIRVGPLSSVQNP